MAKRITLYALSFILLLTTLFGFMPASKVKAVDPDNWNHVIPFTITDTSGVARTNVPVIITYDTDGRLVAYGLVNATATDTYVDSSGASNSPVGSGTAYDYLMASGNITAVIPSLPAYGSVTLNLYTGYSPVQTSFPIILGEGGYFTVADDADLELSANFTIQLNDAWVNTDNASDKYLFDHYDAANGGIRCFVSPTVSENITARIVTANISGTLYLLPDGAGDYTNVSGVSGAATHWEAVDDPVASPDEDSTYVYQSGDAGAEKKDAYALSNPAWLGYNQEVTGVTVYFRHRWITNSGSSIKPYLRLSGSETAGTQLGGTSSWVTNNEALSRPGGGSWTLTDITNLQVAIGLWYSSVPSVQQCTQVYIKVDYTYETYTDVSATEVASEEHTVTTSLRSNIITNGNMEAGSPPTGYTAVNSVTIAREAVVVHSGSYSLKVTGHVALAYGRARQTIAVFAPYAGLRLTFGCWVQAKSTNTQSAVRIVIDDGVSYSSSSCLPQDDTWHWTTVSRTLAAGTTHLWLEYWVTAITAATDIGYFDDTLCFRIDSMPDYYQEGNFLIFIDDVVQDGVVTDSTVPDSTANWTFMNNSTNDFMPYADNVTIEVDGIRQAYYKPNAMINGTTLPDRESNGGNNDGTITWGTNSGMTITGGSIMDSESATSVGVTSAMMQGELFYIGTYASVYLSFQYGLDDNYGYSTSETSAASEQTLSVTLTGLTPNTTYHFRAVARSGVVYSYGADTTFTTVFSISSAGSTTPLINNIGAFSGYQSDGDLLFTAEIVLTYPPYYPTETAYKYFQMQLIDTDGSTILGASPISQWGDRPTSIYFNSTVASGLTYGAEYQIRIANVSSENITNTNETYASGDWYGDDLSNLDWWCIGVAKSMELNDGTTLTDPYLRSVTGRTLPVITNTAGGYFTVGIPLIDEIRPHLFTTSTVTSGRPNISGDIDYNAGTTLTDRLGAGIVADAETVGDVFNISGQQGLLYVILAVVALCIIYVVSQTQGFGALGATILTIPILAASAYYNIMEIMLIVIGLVILAWLIVRQFVIKSM